MDRSQVKAILQAIARAEQLTKHLLWRVHILGYANARTSLPGELQHDIAPSKWTCRSPRLSLGRVRLWSRQWHCCKIRKSFSPLLDRHLASKTWCQANVNAARSASKCEAKLHRWFRKRECQVRLRASQQNRENAEGQDSQKQNGDVSKMVVK